MARLINLLPEISADQKQKDVRLWYLNIGAVGLLSVSALILVGLFALKSNTQAAITKTDGDSTAARTIIARDSEVVNLVSFINSKVTKLSTQLSRADSSGDLQRTLEFLPPEVSLLGFTQGVSGEYIFSATSPTLVDVGTLIETLKTAGSPHFQNFQVRNIQWDEKEAYTFTISFAKASAAPAGKAPQPGASL